MPRSPCPVCALPPELLSLANVQLTARVPSGEIRDILSGQQELVTSRELTNHDRHIRPTVTKPDNCDEPLTELSPNISKDDLLESLYQEALQQVDRLRLLARQTGSIRVEKSLLDASKNLEWLAQSRRRISR